MDDKVKEFLHKLFYCCIVITDRQNECGLVKDIFQIAGGVADVEHTWPWMASLGFKINDTGAGDWWHFCGATLITDSFLLSAAHCVSDTRFPLERYTQFSFSIIVERWI